MANIDSPSFIAELSSVSVFSSVEKANQYCIIMRSVLDKHAPTSLRNAINHNSSPWFESMRDYVIKAKKERRLAERKWRNTKLTIFNDLHRQANLMCTIKCNYYTEWMPLTSSSKELLQIVNILSNRHQHKILPTIYLVLTIPVFSSDT